ncbi:MAG: hypothetical protein CMG35_11345 [Candidatus Marinimicrobia bacterium]|nr:hypothetical protein [Candidatus Neomarinimicrobiota bacterium]|tara:strand:+ start:1338 stop:1850 length:513 start_codon:yes stop_codon:yes gene_type:complete
MNITDYKANFAQTDNNAKTANRDAVKQIADGLVALAKTNCDHAYMVETQDGPPRRPLDYVVSVLISGLLEKAHWLLDTNLPKDETIVSNRWEAVKAEGQPATEIQFNKFNAALAGKQAYSLKADLIDTVWKSMQEAHEELTGNTYTPWKKRKVMMERQRDSAESFFAQFE